MRFEKTIPVVLATLLFPFLLHAQISVSRIDGSFNAGNRDGIIYALPRTLIQVDVTIEQKEMLKGPLSGFAEKYMGVTNIVENTGFEYNLSAVKLSSVPEPDPEHYYFVAKGEKLSKTTWETLVRLNGMGMITAVGDRRQTGQAGTDGLRQVLGSEEVMEMFSKYAEMNLYPKIDTIVRTINIDTVTIEDYSFRTTIIDKPLEVKARETAEMISRIREGRYNLLTGYQEVNYSEGTIRFMNDELLALEKEYMQLFTGAVVRSELTYSFTFLPSEENVNENVAIFNFSTGKGISEGGGGGTQGFIRVENHGNTAAIARGEARSGGGLVYRIPENATVRFIYNGETVARVTLPVSQLGKVASLPPGASDVEFDGETGGLKSVGLEAE
jgi:hypothetical protein